MKLSVILLVSVFLIVAYRLYAERRFAGQFFRDMQRLKASEPPVTRPRKASEEVMTSYEQDSAALQALYRKTLDAWCQGDSKSYASAFTDDADYVAFEGSLSKGRQAIDDGHRVLFEKWLKGSCLDGAVISIRFLSPDAAVLRAFGGTTFNGSPLSRPSVQTYVATKTQGEWLFSNFQNNRVQILTVFDYFILALKKIIFKM